MAESTGLLNLHTGNRITSSNLVLSAIQGQRFPLALIVFIPVPGITNPHRPLSVRGIGAKRQKGFRGNLSPCPSGAVPKGLGVEGLGARSAKRQKGFRGNLSPCPSGAVPKGLGVEGLGARSAKRQKGFRGNLSPCPSGAVPKGLGVEGLGGLSVLPQGKTDRPPLSPKRRPVVYKTNLTNRQQKELLSVRGKYIKIY